MFRCICASCNRFWKGHALSARPLRIAQVAPVAQSVPPAKSGSIETMTALLVDALVSRGHDVTLFATGSSVTKARLHAVFDRGYCEDSSIWPWELCELFNLAAAVEQGAAFDVIHYQAEYSPMSLAFSRLSATPMLQTLHHLPTSAEIALWSKYRDAPFVAVSQHQARALAGLRVVAVIPHAIDTAAFPFRSSPDDYLLFLGRFTEGKGVLQAIDAAHRTRMRLILAGCRERVLPRGDCAARRWRPDRVRGRSRAHRKGGTAGRRDGRCCIRCSRESLLVSSWPRRWRAELPSLRSIAARFAKS